MRLAVRVFHEFKLNCVEITIQYFAGCPHWRIADQRLRKVLADVSSESIVTYELIDSPEAAELVGFRDSPTILVDGRDPFATGDEPVGLSCRVFRTEEGPQGAPTEAQLRKVLGR